MDRNTLERIFKAAINGSAAEVEALQQLRREDGDLAVVAGWLLEDSPYYREFERWLVRLKESTRKFVVELFQEVVHGFGLELLSKTPSADFANTARLIRALGWPEKIAQIPLSHDDPFWQRPEWRGSWSKGRWFPSMVTAAWALDQELLRRFEQYDGTDAALAFGDQVPSHAFPSLVDAVRLGWIKVTEGCELRFAQAAVLAAGYTMPPKDTELLAAVGLDLAKLSIPQLEQLGLYYPAAAKELGRRLVLLPESPVPVQPALADWLPIDWREGVVEAAIEKLSLPAKRMIGDREVVTATEGSAIRSLFAAAGAVERYAIYQYGGGAHFKVRVVPDGNLFAAGEYLLGSPPVCQPLPTPEEVVAYVKQAG